jgi:hypothetical protein
MHRSKQHPLFDHLVGARLQRQGHSKPERPRGLKVDDQFEFRWLENRQIGGSGALENPADVHSGLAIGIRNAGAIAHQAADGGELAPLVDRGNRMARRQRDEFLALAVEEGIAADNERTRPLLNASVGNRSY